MEEFDGSFLIRAFLIERECVYLNVCNQTIRLINEQDVINTKQVYEGSFENITNEHAIDV